MKHAERAEKKFQLNRMKNNFRDSGHIKKLTLTQEKM